MQELVIHTSNAIYSAATVGHFYLEYWTGVSAQAEHYQAQWDLQKAAIQSLGGRTLIGFTYVNGSKFVTPSSDARAILQQRTADLAGKISGIAIVMPAKGFGASMVRGVLASLNFVTRNPIPTDFFTTVSPACAWLAQHSTPSTPAASLEELATEFLGRVHVK